MLLGGEIWVSGVATGGAVANSTPTVYTVSSRSAGVSFSYERERESE